MKTMGLWPGMCVLEMATNEYPFMECGNKLLTLLQKTSQVARIIYYQTWEDVSIYVYLRMCRRMCRRMCMSGIVCMYVFRVRICARAQTQKHPHKENYKQKITRRERERGSYMYDE